MPTRARDQRSKAVVWHTSYLVIILSRQDTSLCLQNVYTSAGIVENTIADGTYNSTSKLWKHVD